LELHGDTLREIFDAAAEADATLQAHTDAHTLPVGWIHKSTIEREGHSVNTWSFLASVPRNWERSLPKQQ